MISQGVHTSIQEEKYSFVIFRGGGGGGGALDLCMSLSVNSILFFQRPIASSTRHDVRMSLSANYISHFQSETEPNSGHHN